MGDSSDDETADTGDQPETPDTQGEYLAYEGSPTITGTAGNDLLGPSVEEPFGPFDVDLIETGDGNDLVVNFGDYVNATVNGGNGDDELLSRGDGHNMNYNGDAGDDIIEVGRSDAGNGGAGDDTLIFEANIIGGYDPSDLPEAVLTGGEGADRFEINLDLWADLVTLEESETPFQVDLGIAITDFEPGDDALVIRLGLPDGVEVRPLSSVEVIDDEVVLTFDQIGDAPGVQAYISLEGA